MVKSNSPKIHSGMLKQELLEIADRMKLKGVKKLKKSDLVNRIQTELDRLSGKIAQKASSSKKARNISKSLASSKKTKAKVSSSEKARKALQSPAQPRITQASTAKKTKRGGIPDSTVKKTFKKQEVAEATSEPPQPRPVGAFSDQSKITATKYGTQGSFDVEELRQVDAHLPGLPDGYGEDRIVLLPRDPEWLYAYWDIRYETKDEARKRGGTNFSLRLFEQIDGQLEPIAEQWIQEFSRSWYLRVPSPGQTYVVEIGYRDRDGGWLGLMQSNRVNVPPLGPASEVADHFVTISLNDRRARANHSPHLAEPGRTRAAMTGGSHTENVEGSTKSDGNSSKADLGASSAVHEAAYQASQSQIGGVQPGSGSMQVGGSPSSGPPWAGSQPPRKEREGESDFWLLADAELVVFGATEPNAKVYLSGKRIPLRKDGSFSVRMAFPNGRIEIPIEALAVEGEQRRGLSMRFQRETEQGSHSQDQSLNKS